MCCFPCIMWSSLQGNAVRARCYSPHTLVLNCRWVSPPFPTKKKWIWHLYRREGQLSSFLFWESFLEKVMGIILGPHFLKCLYSPESQLPLKCKCVPLESKSLWSSYYLFNHKLPSKDCIAAQDPSFKKIVSEIPSCA